MPRAIVAHDHPFEWSERTKEILELVFEGRMKHRAIAAKMGMHERSLTKYLSHPDFKAALAAKRADLEESLYEHGTPYVTKQSRIIALSEVAEQARLEFEAHPLLLEKRQIGTDENGDPMWLINEKFNRDAHDSFRQALTDIAKELGHRVTKTEITGKDGGVIAIADITDEIRSRLAGIAAARSARVIPERVD